MLLGNINIVGLFLNLEGRVKLGKKKIVKLVCKGESMELLGIEIFLEVEKN